MSSNANGSAPGRDARSALAQHVEALRQMIRVEADSRSEYERLVEESKERERRLVKAVAALEGVPLSAGGRPKAQASAKGPKTHQVVAPVVADEVLVVIRRLLAETGESTVTRPQLIKAMPGRSGETVRRGLKLLREQERVRVAGRAGNGGRTSAVLYALMPDGD
jgi:hypothetical protein